MAPRRPAEYPRGIRGGAATSRNIRARRPAEYPRGIRGGAATAPNPRRHQNDGSQNFATRVATTDANGAYDVFVADVDGDSDLDLLAAELVGQTVSWYRRPRRTVSDDPSPRNIHVVAAAWPRSVSIDIHVHGISTS